MSASLLLSTIRQSLASAVSYCRRGTAANPVEEAEEEEPSMKKVCNEAPLRHFRGYTPFSSRYFSENPFKEGLGGGEMRDLRICSL